MTAKPEYSLPGPDAYEEGLQWATRAGRIANRDPERAAQFAQIATAWFTAAQAAATAVRYQTNDDAADAAEAWRAVAG